MGVGEGRLLSTCRWGAIRSCGDAMTGRRVFPIRSVVREKTPTMHLRKFGGTPACTVLFQDSEINGVIRRLQMTHVVSRVTCKRCLKTRAAKMEGWA